MYYTTIPLVSERPNNRRWDASKLRELRKRLDSGTMSVDETDQVAGDFLDGEIVDLASDWLGNTVGITCMEQLYAFSLKTTRRLFKSYLRNAPQLQGLRCWNESHLTWP